MKKLYFLNETEKERILNLYESKGNNKNILNEQTIPLIPYPSGISKGAVDAILAASKNRGSLQGEMLTNYQIKQIDNKFGSDTYQKFLNAGGESVLMKKKRFGYTENLKGWHKYPCVAYHPNAKKFSRESIDGSVSYEIDGIDYYGGGRKKDKTGKMSDYHCGGDENMEIKEGPKPPAETLVGWDKFPCVTTNLGAKKVSLKDGSVTYEINGVYYYGGGRKKDKSGKTSDYHCGGDGNMEIKEGPKPIGGTNAAVSPTTNQGYYTNKLANVGQKLGVQTSGQLTQDMMNKLMDKLGGTSSTSTGPTTPIEL